jgi:hypothetical protein
MTLNERIERYEDPDNIEQWGRQSGFTPVYYIVMAALVTAGILELLGVKVW